MKEIIDTLLNQNRFFIASHVNPDGDAIGSLVAMGLALEESGKEVVMYNESPIPSPYRFLTGVDQVTCDTHSLKNCDVAIVIDCGDIQRLGLVAGKIDDFSRVINIDHHATNNEFGHLKLVDPKACASAELIYRLIIDMGLTITTPIASALYTGILTDTGSFRFSNTNKNTFSICETLVAAGADPAAVAKHLYGQYSIGRLKLLNMALDSIEISENGKLSMMSVTRRMLLESGTVPDDVDGMINYARRIEDIELAVLIREKRNGNGGRDLAKSYQVSLRSNGEVDVAVIAATFGGGGHPTAAGFLAEATLPQLKNKIWALADSL